jgi:membrane-associated phospholipid phosphatase
MLTARQSDGSAATSTYAPQPLNTPGAWQPPSTGGGAWGVGTGTFLKAEWGNVRTFGVPEGTPGDPDPVGTWANPNGSYFRPAAPPTLTSAEYTAAFDEVKQLGSASSSIRTADQTEIAYFWVDGPGTASPPGHWNRIAQTLASSMNLSLVESARLFALLGIAEADTAITTWEAKRHYDLWRPDHAIAQADIDGNPGTAQDVNWEPLIPTPSFPSYTSGHSAFSMTGAVILANFYGSDNFAFVTDTESPFLPPGTTRSFTSFSDAAEEAGLSRIYGGIHYSFDNTAGQEIGANVGNYIFSNYLTPVPEPGSSLLVIIGAALLQHRRRKK